MNMQAICDDLLRFRWIDINWPGSSSDYMAWVTSSLYADLEDNEITRILAKGMTLLGDNAYITHPTLLFFPRTACGYYQARLEAWTWPGSTEDTVQVPFIWPRA